MPSYLHESLLELFRNRSKSAAELLIEIDVPIPEYDEVRTESTDLNDVKPAEYRADLVLLLVRESQPVFSIIVEVQLARDEDKPYSWPAYVANLRARHRCPVCLLVITLDESIARWANSAIELGPGTRCQPWVIGPANMPVVTGFQQAEENVELAVLSAVEHGQSPDIELAAAIASAAIVASANIDAERSKLYLDLLTLSLSQNARKSIEANMNPFTIEYQNEFARLRYGQGKAEGLVEGQTKLILKMLAARFGPLPDSIQTRVCGANDSELDALAERLLTAQSLEQALGSAP